MSDTGTLADRIQKPLSVFDWIVVFFLLGIPVLGLVLLLYWSFGNDININKKNFSKAMLLVFIVTFALAVVFALLFGQLFSMMKLSYPVHI